MKEKQTERKAGSIAKRFGELVVEYNIEDHGDHPDDHSDDKQRRALDHKIRVSGGTPDGRQVEENRREHSYEKGHPEIQRFPLILNET